MTADPDLQGARARDQADPLAAFRERFALPTNSSGEPLVYLCGHSLGLMPREARALVAQELEDWARLGVLGHEQAMRPWITYHRTLREGLAALAGALPDEVVAMNSLSVNLHLFLASFFRPAGRCSKILIEAGAFSSDRHAVASQLAWHGLAPDCLVELGPEAGRDLVSLESFEDCLRRNAGEIALVLWPGVQFRTGQAFDLARLVGLARQAGCIVGLDLAHAIGNLPLALHADGPDFAVWCSYKYLNAGPGAIGGGFVHERHFAAAPSSRLHGWWGNRADTRFRMEPAFEPAHGADAWQISNPPVLSAAPLGASLKLFESAGLEQLRLKSVALTAALESRIAPLAPAVSIITPREPAARGCQLSLRIAGSGARGRRVFDRLAELGAICDWREPDVIRVAPVPLYNTFVDVYHFGELLGRAVRESA